MESMVIKLGFDNLEVALWWWHELGGTLTMGDSEYVLIIEE